MITKEQPLSNVGEVTLIGTGGGYGESCVIHLGDRNWVVVDSCVNPLTKKSLPLEYLQSLNVDLKNDVKLIICTHWHDDHILGISSLLDVCENANFSCARTNDRVKFLRLVSLDYQKLEKQASKSSTIEFNKCLEIIRDRNQTILNASIDRVLFSSSSSGNKSEVISLSPSDRTIEKFDDEISTLITDFGVSNRKIVLNSPNSKSVALFIKLGYHRVLLGSDLEVSEDNNYGWLNILDHSQVLDHKSSLFKIPHHGSENSYHNRIWTELLLDNPVANLTPFNKGKKLPNEEMLRKFQSHTNNLHLTSQIQKRDKKIKRDKSINKIIARYRPSLREIPFIMGIIRCQIDLLNPDANWNIELFGESIKY